MTHKELGAGLIGLLALIIGFFIFVFTMGAGEEITRAIVPERGDAAITFKMPDARVELFAEIDLVMDDAPTDDQDEVQLPDALNYAVEVYADGELVFSRECEAIYPRFFEWSSVTTDPDNLLSLTRERIQYLGRLERCTIVAEPGQDIVVSAHRVWRIPEYEAYMRQTEIVAKLPGQFSGM